MGDRSLLLFGARSGAGLHLARLARQRHFMVTAAIRPGSDDQALTALGCRIVRADAMDGAAVTEAFQLEAPPDVVISTLGAVPGHAPVDAVGNRHVIDAARMAGVARFVLVSSLGAGDSRPFASPRLLAALGSVLDGKSQAEEHLRATWPNHLILRPGGLLDIPMSGDGAVYERPDLHGTLSRSDLADLILRCLGDPRTQGKTLTALGRGRLTSDIPADELSLAP